MPTETRRLVVRPQSRRGTTTFYVACAAVGVLVLWGTFEAGRATAGFSLARWYAERRALVGERDAERKRVAELTAEVSGAAIQKRVDAEAYAQVEKSLADLQSRLGEQSQELAFYRGIVSPADGMSGLRVQRLRVLPGVEAHQYRLRVVLIQAGRQDAAVAGSLEVTVDGQQAGRAVSLPLGEIADQSKALSFSFRYFQELEADITLPADFEPQRVQVEVRTKAADAPVRQAYVWKLETA